MTDERMTVILSGPITTTDQAVKALEAAGLEVDRSPSHQLPDRVDGTVDPTVAFISVMHVDAAAIDAITGPLLWSVRAIVGVPHLTQEAVDEDERLRRIVREELAKGT